MLSLSGGADSTAVACQVKLMVDFGVADLGIDGFKAKLDVYKRQAPISVSTSRWPKPSTR